MQFQSFTAALCAGVVVRSIPSYKVLPAGGELYENMKVIK